MVKSCVFFALRTELLNIIQTSFGFRGLNTGQCNEELIIDDNSKEKLNAAKQADIRFIVTQT
jgi:hypothetical protein